MDFVWRKYSEDEGSGGKAGSFTPPAFLDDFEALDLVYQRLARNLEIKTRRSTRDASMPVMKYGIREFDPRKDKLSQARVRMGMKGKLELSVKQYEVDHKIEYESRKQNIPRVRLVKLDTSGSTKSPVDSSKEGIIMNPWAPAEVQWTSNSIYHHELVAWYGLLELLRKQGTLNHQSVRLVNYSGETRIAENLTDSKKLALSPQFGGTNLDIDEVHSIICDKKLMVLKIYF